jgi:hypothetical protein
MLIALDYDGTYTADVELWDRFIAHSRANGHRVFVVTMRFPHEGDEISRRLLGKVDRIIYTSRGAKRRHLERLGHAVHVWIDNHPEHIIGDASASSLEDVPRWAQWKAQCARTFRVVWPENPAATAHPETGQAGTAEAPAAQAPAAAVVAQAPAVQRQSTGPAAQTSLKPEAAQTSIRPEAAPTAVPRELSNRLVTVHGFKIWSASQGRYRVSKFKAPREILEQYDVVVIEDSAEVVPRADLDRRGRYRPPEFDRPEASWRSSSFDLQSGLEVTEHGVIPRSGSG